MPLLLRAVFFVSLIVISAVLFYHSANAHQSNYHNNSSHNSSSNRENSKDVEINSDDCDKDSDKEDEQEESDIPMNTLTDKNYTSTKDGILRRNASASSASEDWDHLSSDSVYSETNHYE